MKLKNIVFKMKVPTLLGFCFFIFLLIPTWAVSQSENNNPQQQLVLSADQTSAIALIFSMIQCMPNGSDELLGATQSVIRTNRNFNPEHHLQEYSNLTEIENLLTFVQKIKASGVPDNLPFTTDPETINNFQIVFTVLWNNANDWSLFYNTVAWLIGRVNSALLFWSLMIVCEEKFSETVIVPNAAEIFPQLYLRKEWVLSVAGLESPRYISDNPLYYWMTDPDLNVFHTHWHMSLPFWWDARRYGVFRYRKGDLFLYMHHQIINRYNAERLSNWLPEATPLEIRKDFYIPEGYNADIVNVDFEEFPSRPDLWALGNIDDGQGITLDDISRMLSRISNSIDLGYFRSGVGGNGSVIWLKDDNASDIIGSTLEASFVYSPDYNFYGTPHNFIHQYLSGMLRAKRDPIPGVQAHQETSLRDRVFYQLHTLINNIHLKYKRQLAPPYTKKDLEFPGIGILDVKILTCSETTFTSGLTYFPFALYQQPTPTITTYMTTKTFDISTAARPCLSVNDEPVNVKVPALNYVPFTYAITVQSWRPQVSYGMVRIFIWPEYKFDGTPLTDNDAHVRAIELDRFHVRLEPGRVTVITRSSLDSSLTKTDPNPGIKTLYNVDAGSGLLGRPEMRRACGFPNNLLIPKGTREGVPFKLTVYISDETDMGEVDENQYIHYPFCGALKGLPFPDKRSMGFPFDRPGTNFSVSSDNSQFSNLLGCSKLLIPNVRQIKVIVKHVDGIGKMFM